MKQVVKRGSELLAILERVAMDDARIMVERSERQRRAAWWLGAVAALVAVGVAALLVLR